MIQTDLENNVFLLCRQYGLTNASLENIKCRSLQMMPKTSVSKSLTRKSVGVEEAWVKPSFGKTFTTETFQR